MFATNLKQGIMVGKIYSKKKINTITYIDNINSFDKIDNNMPCLIIGWKNACTIYGNVNILDKKIDNNIFWTFSKTEKRTEYEKDIEKFYEYCFTKLKKELVYCNINILTSGYNRIKKLVKLIDCKKKNKVIYIKDEQLYICYKNNVFGVSLSDCEYIGISTNKILDKIKKNKNNILIYENDFLGNKIKTYIGDSNIIIPYLYSLKMSEGF
jgi:hypothetical protein